MQLQSAITLYMDANPDANPTDMVAYKALNAIVQVTHILDINDMINALCGIETSPYYNYALAMIGDRRERMVRTLYYMKHS